jgi:calcineurin-like phosphoesterase family protein
VAAVINTGDVVTDGQYPAHWKRFLRITRPLSKRIPYFPVAGNHERTDTELGIANWRTATGLPVGGERLYYCFDSADGWVRFIALDSNPMTDPANYWARDTEVKYSDEQITWTIQRLKEHVGPALVFLHHPPFCIGYHRPEWENDPVLRERRARLVKALQESGLSLLVAGHEHAYERALLTSGDAVLIVIVTGGAGSPLHSVPVAQAPALFSQYQVEGSQFKPENVYAADAFHYIHLRLWFGGGQFFTYEVDNAGHQRLIDQATIDLKRWGVPEIDQHKVVLPPKPQGPSQPPPKEETAKKAAVTTDSDSLSATQRLKSGQPPAKKTPVRKPAPRPKARPR